MKVWSRVGAAVMVSMLVGCADGAKLVQEHENGGVVVYPFKDGQGSLLSAFRKDALAVMKEKCGGSYDIVREGEVKGRSRVVNPIEGQEEVIHERRWGIQFQCK
jgi:hypothetical protein